MPEILTDDQVILPTAAPATGQRRPEIIPDEQVELAPSTSASRSLKPRGLKPANGEYLVGNELVPPSDPATEKSNAVAIANSFNRHRRPSVMAMAGALLQERSPVDPIQQTDQSVRDAFDAYNSSPSPPQGSQAWQDKMDTDYRVSQLEKEYLQADPLRNPKHYNQVANKVLVALSGATPQGDFLNAEQAKIAQEENGVLGTAALALQNATVQALGIKNVGEMAGQNYDAYNQMLAAAGQGHPVSAGIGSAIPMAVGGGINPLLGAALGGVAGGSSAMEEGRAQGHSAGETALLAAERGIPAAVMGLIPGEAQAANTVGKILGQAGMGMLKGYEINALQQGGEAALKQSMGMAGPSVGEAVTEATTSPGAIAGAVLPGVVQGLSAFSQGVKPQTLLKRAPTNTVQPKAVQEVAQAQPSEAQSAVAVPDTDVVPGTIVAPDTVKLSPTHPELVPPPKTTGPDPDVVTPQLSPPTGRLAELMAQPAVPAERRIAPPSGPDIAEAARQQVEILKSQRSQLDTLKGRVTPDEYAAAAPNIESKPTEQPQPEQMGDEQNRRASDQLRKMGEYNNDLQKQQAEHIKNLQGLVAKKNPPTQPVAQPNVEVGEGIETPEAVKAKVKAAVDSGAVRVEPDVRPDGVGAMITERKQAALTSMIHVAGSEQSTARELPPSEQTTAQITGVSLGRQLGTEVVVADMQHFPKGTPSGFVSDAAPDVLVVNANSKNPVGQIVGHEVVHALSRMGGDSMDRLMSTIKQVEPEALNRGEQQYLADSDPATRRYLSDPANKAKLREEALASIMAEAVKNPDFLDQLGRSDPKTADALRSVVGTVNSKVSKSGLVKKPETLTALVEAFKEMKPPEIVGKAPIAGEQPAAKPAETPQEAAKRLNLEYDGKMLKGDDAADPDMAQFKDHEQYTLLDENGKRGTSVVVAPGESLDAAVAKKREQMAASRKPKLTPVEPPIPQTEFASAEAEPKSVPVPKPLKPVEPEPAPTHEPQQLKPREPVAKGAETDPEVTARFNRIVSGKPTAEDLTAIGQDMDLTRAERQAAGEEFRKSKLDGLREGDPNAVADVSASMVGLLKKQAVSILGGRAQESDIDNLVQTGLTAINQIVSGKTRRSAGEIEEGVPAPDRAISRFQEGQNLTGFLLRPARSAMVKETKSLKSQPGALPSYENERGGRTEIEEGVLASTAGEGAENVYHSALSQLREQADPEARLAPAQTVEQAPPEVLNKSLAKRLPGAIIEGMDGKRAVVNVKPVEGKTVETATDPDRGNLLNYKGQQVEVYKGEGGWRMRPFGSEDYRFIDPDRNPQMHADLDAAEKQGRLLPPASEIAQHLNDQGWEQGEVHFMPDKAGPGEDPDEVRVMFQKAKSELPGQRTIGEPRYAGVGAEGSDERLTDNVMRYLERGNGLPEHITNAVTERAGQMLLQEPDKVKARVLEAGAGGPQLNAPEVFAAKQQRLATLTDILGTDQTKADDAFKMAVAFDKAKTHMGRAFQMLADKFMTPKQRAGDFLLTAVHNMMEQEDAGHTNKLRPHGPEFEDTPPSGAEILKPVKPEADIDIPTGEEDIPQGPPQSILKPKEDAAATPAAEPDLPPSKPMPTELDPEAARLREVLEKVKKKLKVRGIDLDQTTEENWSDRDWVDKTLRSIQTLSASKNAMAYEYWINSILSAPISHARNLFGNTGMFLWENGPQRFAETMANSVIQDKRSAQWGEYKHIMAGLWPGFKKAGESMVRAFKHEVLPYDDELARVDVGDLMTGHGKVSIPDEYGGRVIRIPVRMLRAADAFATTLGAHVQVGAEAYRQAKGEGLSGPEMATRMHELQADTASIAWQKAMKASLRGTFKDNGRFADAAGTVRDAISSLLPGVDSGKWLVPFPKTPGNIIGTALEKSPLGAIPMGFKMAGDLVRMGKGSKPSYTRSPEGTRAMAEQIIAWGSMLAIHSMIASGNLTGPEDNESDMKAGERDIKSRTKPKNSIYVGGKWRAYDQIEPFGTALSLMVSAHNRLLGAASGKGAGNEMEGAARDAISIIRDKSFLKGLGDITRAVESPQKALPNMAADFASSWVPNVIRATARESRDEQPNMRVSGDGIQWVKELGKVTGAKAGLDSIAPGAFERPPKVDLWGRPVKNGSHSATDFLYRLTVPMKVQGGNEATDLDRMITNWNNEHPNAGWYPVAPPRSLMRGSASILAPSDRTYEIPADQYEEFAKRSGEMAYDILKGMDLNIEKPSVMDMNLINKILSKSRNTISKEMFGGAKLPASEVPAWMNEQQQKELP